MSQWSQTQLQLNQSEKENEEIDMKILQVETSNKLLNTELSHLRASLVSVESQRTEHWEKAQKLEQELVESKHKIELLTNSSDFMYNDMDVRQYVGLLQQQIKEYQIQIESLKSNLNIKIENINNLSNQNHEYHSTIETMELNLKKVREQNESLLEANTQHERLMLEWQMKKLTLERSEEELKLKLKQVDSELKDSLVQSGQLRRCVVTLEARISEKETRIQELTKSVETLKEHHEEQLIQELTKQKQKLLEEYESSLNNEKQKIDKEKHLIETEKHESQEQLLMLEKTLSNTFQSLSEWKEKAEKYEKELNELIIEKEKQENELKNKIKEIDINSELHLLKVKDTERKLGQVINDLNITREQLATTEEQLLKSGGRVAEAMNSKSEIQSQLLESNEKIKNLEEQLLEMLNQKNVIEDLNNNIRTKLESTISKLTITENELKSAQDSILSEQYKNSQLEKELSDLKFQLDNTNHNIEYLTNQIIIKEKEYNEKLKQLETTEETLQNVIHQLNEQKNKYIELEKKYSLLDNKYGDSETRRLLLEGMTQDAEKRLIESECRVRQVETKNAYLETKVFENASEAVQLREKCSALDAQVLEQHRKDGQWAARWALLEGRFKESDSQLNEKDVQIQSLRHQLTAFEKERAELLAKLPQSETHRAELSARLMAADRLLVESEARRSDLNSRLTSCKYQLVEAENQLQSVNNRLLQTESQLSISEQQRLELDTRLITLIKKVTDSDMNESEYQSRISALKMKLNENIENEKKIRKELELKVRYICEEFNKKILISENELKNRLVDYDHMTERLRRVEICMATISNNISRLASPREQNQSKQIQLLSDELMKLHEEENQWEQERTNIEILLSQATEQLKEKQLLVSKLELQLEAMGMNVDSEHDQRVKVEDELNAARVKLEVALQTCQDRVQRAEAVAGGEVSVRREYEEKACAAILKLNQLLNETEVLLFLRFAYAT